jgi:DeoR/GlpR family transcriptional regulator of sugar metabolism
MMQEERLSKISEKVNREKFCSIKDIAAHFGVSKATVRRDLQALSDRTMIRLTRGGAAAIASGTTQEPAYSVKAGTNHEEKVRIGIKSASLVSRGETVILDSGTTARQIAEALMPLQDINVVTNDISIACRLAEAKGISLTVIGGSLRRGYYSTQGYLAVHALENINADKVFIGVDALDVKKGCMITNDAEVMVKKLMLQSAKSVIVACDHSKFDGVAFMSLCTLDQVDMIITGREVNPSISQVFTDAGVNLLLV